MSVAKTRFDELVEDARCDPNIVGLVLGGSRGKGAYIREYTDYHAYVILTDGASTDEYLRRFPSRHGDSVEYLFHSLDGFRKHALPGTESRWNAYTFAHVEPVVDKLDGEIGRIVRAKGVASPGADADSLDGYINAYYRSARNLGDGRVLESHLDAAESVSWFLEFLFAAHGRVRPYNKWLIWELQNHPLEPPWAPDVPRRLEQLVTTGDLPEQRLLFADAEAFARHRGLDEVIDAWEPDLPLLRG